MIEPPEQYRFWSVIHAAMDTVSWVILVPFLLEEMLSAPEVRAKLQDKGFESGRIEQVGHCCFSGLEFLVGYGDHGGVSCGSLFGVKGRKDGNLTIYVFESSYSVKNTLKAEVTLCR